MNCPAASSISYEFKATAEVSEVRYYNDVPPADLWFAQCNRNATIKFLAEMR